MLRNLRDNAPLRHRELFWEVYATCTEYQLLSMSIIFKKDILDAMRVNLLVSLDKCISNEPDIYIKDALDILKRVLQIIDQKIIQNFELPFTFSGDQMNILKISKAFFDATENDSELNELKSACGDVPGIAIVESVDNVYAFQSIETFHVIGPYDVVSFPKEITVEALQKMIRCHDELYPDIRTKINMTIGGALFIGTDARVAT